VISNDRIENFPARDVQAASSTATFFGLLVSVAPYFFASSSLLYPVHGGDVVRAAAAQPAMAIRPIEAAADDGDVAAEKFAGV
jgi:hypothetical protein